MKKKTYTIEIKHRNGATLHIGVYADAPHPFRIYYCGRDIGLRYEKCGNAARYLLKTLKEWGPGATETTGTIDDLPKKGEVWNLKLFEYWYNGAKFPVRG